MESLGSLKILWELNTPRVGNPITSSSFFQNLTSFSTRPGPASASASVLIGSTGVTRSTLLAVFHHATYVLFHSFSLAPPLHATAPDYVSIY